MDSNTNDKLKATGSSPAFVPQSGGATTHQSSSLRSEPPETKIKFGSSNPQTGRPTENLKTAVSNTGKEYLGKAQGAWDDTQERVRSVHEKSERYVRENPIKAVVSAFGIGFVFGLIFRRR